MKIIAVFSAFIIVLVGIVATIALAPTSLGIKQGELDGNYGRVLADIEGISEKNPRYVDLAFLGAHDANTATMETTGRMDENSSKAFSTFFPVIKNVAYRFGVTQAVGIYELLKQGVRYLHIKVTYYDNEWYTSHSLLTGKLSEHVVRILKFLSEPTSAGEIVTVLFHTVYMGNQSINDFREALTDITYDGKNLYDYVNYGVADEFNDGNGKPIGELRYNDVTASDKAGVVLLEKRTEKSYADIQDNEESNRYFYNLENVATNEWHQRNDAKLLMRDVVDNCKYIASTDKYKDMLRINQTQASLSVQSVSDIAAVFTSVSLLKIAEKHNVALIEREDFLELLKAAPVFQVDYATSTENDFNKRVNALIRVYNEELVKSI